MTTYTVSGQTEAVGAGNDHRGHPIRCRCSTCAHTRRRASLPPCECPHLPFVDAPSQPRVFSPAACAGTAPADPTFTAGSNQAAAQAQEAAMFRGVVSTAGDPGARTGQQVW